jgi:hypothetical protein
VVGTEWTSDYRLVLSDVLCESEPPDISNRTTIYEHRMTVYADTLFEWGSCINEKIPAAGLTGARQHVR